MLNISAVTAAAAFDTLTDHFGPNPKFDVPLVFQQEDAWCYAASTEMVVNFVRRGLLNAQLIEQCQVASLVKEAHCCIDIGEIMDPRCIESGCQKDQIPTILESFGVRADQFGPLELPDVVREINDGDPASGRPASPLLVILDWRGDPGSHALVVTGVLGDMVYVLDPLEDQDHGGWRDIETLRNGFGQGDWVETWLGFREE